MSLSWVEHLFQQANQRPNKRKLLQNGIEAPFKRHMETRVKSLEQNLLSLHVTGVKKGDCIHTQTFVTEKGGRT